MNITLAVCGSIACYKTLDLLRILVKDNHRVNIILTNGALQFVLPQTYRYLGASEVFLPGSDFETSIQPDSPVKHVSLAKETELLIIAPLSANTLAKLALGLADDFLTNFYLCYRGKTVVFPAMNSDMLSHPNIQSHLQKLATFPLHHIANPQEGKLICNTQGNGKLPPLNAIVDFSLAYHPRVGMTKHPSLHFIVTLGSTIAPLDPVRFLANYSTGTMGIELIKAAIGRGHTVTAMAGPLTPYPWLDQDKKPWVHHQLEWIAVETTLELLDAVKSKLSRAQAYIAAGAPVDFQFKVNSEKIKKDKIDPTLSFSSAPDVLKYVCEESLKRSHLHITGFAAETKLDETVLLKKHQAKPVHLLVGNEVFGNRVSPKGFGDTINHYLLYQPTLSPSFTRHHLDKKSLAKILIEKAEIHHENHHTQN